MWNRQYTEDNVSEHIDRRTRIQIIDIVDALAVGIDFPRLIDGVALEEGHEDATDPEPPNHE